MTPGVRIYGAPDCHLCDEAKRVLHEVWAELPFDLEEVDITGDPELERRYRERIPVVTVGGEEAFPSCAPRGARRGGLRGWGSP